MVKVFDSQTRCAGGARLRLFEGLDRSGKEKDEGYQLKEKSGRYTCVRKLPLTTPQSQIPAQNGPPPPDFLPDVVSPRQKPNRFFFFDRPNKGTTLLSPRAFRRWR